MPDWDAVIVGGGPAGLTAGLYLGRAKRRVLVLDKDTPGGYIRNIELIENYPGFASGIAGAKLASEMLAQARAYDVETAAGEVSGIEVFSGSRYVTCADGRGYTAGVVIFAGGSRNRKLGVPGEAELTGKGVFECAFCDGGHYAGKTVAVCGGGDAGVTEALYLASIAARVIVVEALPDLTAAGVLCDRLGGMGNIETRCGQRVTAVTGTDRVEGITLSGPDGVQNWPVDGVLVHVGLKPNTDYLDGIVALDEHGQILVNERLETDVPGVLAAGDIRSGSPRQVVTAVGDGARAGITAVRLLQEAG